MGIVPREDLLMDLLRSCGGMIDSQEEIEIVSFDMFARTVALLLEENAMEKGSTSSY